MSQKAICPRGHIWDPSTLAGLPPTETPRCPICGEEEAPRIRQTLARLGRWCRNNSLLAGLSCMCFVLSVILLSAILLARSRIQAAREEEEKAQFVAAEIGTQLQSAMRRREREERQLHNREIDFQEAKLVNMEKEFQARLREAEKAARDARLQRDEQIHLRKLAEEMAQTSEQVRQEAMSRGAEAVRRLIKMYVTAGARFMETGDLSASLLWFTEALRLAEKEKLPVQIHRLRLAYVLAQCPRPVQMWLHEKKLNVVQLSSDGKRVLIAAATGAVEVWDATNGKRLGEGLAHAEAVTHAVFSPDGKRALTAAADKTLHLWDVESAQELISPVQVKGPIAGLVFSRNGKRFLAVIDKDQMGAAEVELYVWDAASGEAVRETALGSDIRALPAAFSPDGQRVLTMCQDRCARIWDIATGKQLGPAFTHEAALVQAAFSDDGERVLTASVDGLARVWKTQTGEPRTPFLKHGASVRGASFRADGQFALTYGEDRSVRVWDVDKGEAAGPALRHSEAVSEAVFSPDGRFVLTACADGTVRLWDYRKAEECLPALRHGEPIRYAALSAGGDSVLTFAGRMVRLWDLTEGELGRVSAPRLGALTRPSSQAPAELEVFSPDGMRVLRAIETTVRVYDTQTNQPIGGTLPHKNKVTAAVFSPDGNRALTVCHQRNGEEMEGHIRVWETTTGALLGQPLVHPRSVLEAGFSRDGRRVVTACQDGKARLWDVAKNTLVGEPMEHKQDLSRALFLPDGKRLLTVDVEGGLRLWDAETAESVGPTWGHRKPIHHLSFSPDGQRLVTASDDGAASVWEASTGREIATTPVQGAPVQRAEFSPDGKRIVTVSGDKLVRVWGADDGKPVSPPLRHRADVALAAFSEDGKRIVTMAGDGLRVWDAENGEPISPVLRHEVRAASISGAVAAGNASGLHFAAQTRIKAEERPVAELVRVAQVLCAERLTDAGQTVSVDSAELEKEWKHVRTMYSKDFAPSPHRLIAWHQRGAGECESRNLWIGALKHLDYLIDSGGSTDLFARRGRVNLELRHWEAAQTDFTQALAGDKERWDLWSGRAGAEAALGRWQAAESDYSKAIERKSNRAELWAARGCIEAERAEWRKAAADLGKAFHLGEQDVTVSRQNILALLASGDQASYRRWCERLVQRFGDSKDPAVFQKVVWTVALTEGALRDWKPLLRRAERSGGHGQELAVLLYRDGQFDAARKCLQQPTEASSGDHSYRNSLVMAIATQRLGNGLEAKKWLDKAEQIHAEETKARKASWEDRLIHEILYKEAESLLKKGKR